MAIAPLDRRLFSAIHSGSFEATVNMLRIGADANARFGFHSALTLASSENMGQICRELVGAGAEVSQPVAGYSPLHWACALGPDAVGPLLALGADSTAAAPDTGSTPAHIAVEAGNAKALHALGAAGAALDLLDADGLAPIHIAAQRASPTLLLALIFEGVDPNRRAADGRVALHRATPECAEILLQAGASPVAVDAEGLSPIDTAPARSRRAIDQASEAQEPQRPAAPDRSKGRTMGS